MTYYFGTNDQIQGDSAFKNKEYSKALAHYENALVQLKESIATTRFQNDNSLLHAYAYVLGEIVGTTACLIFNLEKNEEGFKQVLKFEQKAQGALTLAITSSNLLPSSIKEELRKKLALAQFELNKSYGEALWYRAFALRAANDRPLLEQALGHMDAYMVVLDDLSKNVSVSAQIGQATRLKSAINQRLKAILVHEREEAQKHSPLTSEPVKDALSLLADAAAIHSERAADQSHSSTSRLKRTHSAMSASFFSPEPDNASSPSQREFHTVRRMKSPQPKPAVASETPAYQSRLNCFINVLAKSKLTATKIASLLSFAADYYTTQNRKAVDFLIQDTLYEQALALSEDSKLINDIANKRSQLRCAQPTLFAHNVYFSQPQPVVLPFAITTQEGLLSNFKELLTNFLTELEAVYPEQPNDFYDLFYYLVAQIDDEKIIKAKQVKILLESLDKLCEQSEQSEQLSLS